MGINPQITTDSWGVDSKDWTVGRKGWDTCRSVTLNLSLFTSVLGFGEFIPSGTVIAEVGTSGLFGPYDPDGVDGRETADGHLFEAVRLTDSMGNAFTRAGAAMLWEGIVLRNKLPQFSGTEGELDAAAEADLNKFIRYER